MTNEKGSFVMNCEIIKSLMPLYCDNVCSEQVKKTIEEHIAECADCRKLFEIYTTEIPTNIIEENQKASKPFKKIKRSIFKSKIITALLGAVLVGILGAGCYLTYGQIVREPYLPSFETIIMKSHNEKIISKLVEGDIDYIMNNTSIMPCNSVYLNFEDIEEHRRKVLTNFYNECLKDKKTVVKVLSNDYSDMLSGGVFTSTRVSISTDEGSIQFDVDNMEMGDVIVPFEAKGELFEKHYAILVNTLYPDDYNSLESALEISQKISGEYLINKFTDGTEEYTTQLESRITDVMEGMTCENILFSNHSFKKEKECYTIDINIFFKDENDNRIVYKNTFEIFGGNLIVSEDYKPVIINDGVSEEKEEQLLNLF